MDRDLLSKLGKTELVALARDKGLPVSGTVAELVERLVAAPADAGPDPDPLGAFDDEADPSDVASTEPSGEASEVVGEPEGADIPTGALQGPGEAPEAVVGAVSAPSAPPVQQTEYTREYGLPREGHTTDLHLVLLRRIVEDAMAAGLAPRAQTARCRGLSGGGVTYEVRLRKQ